MNKLQLLGAMSAAIICLSKTSPAALVDNGGGFIYDNVLDITWVQPDNDFKTWDSANTFAAGLTLGGVSGWRLPYISVVAGAGPLPLSQTSFIDCGLATELACRDNELGYMFFYNLGGTIGNPISVSSDPNLALFPTLVNNIVWSGTEGDSSLAWGFGFQDSNQHFTNKSNTFITWAVHSGDISAVPLPAAVWLFVSGLLGLIGTARRKKA